MIHRATSEAVACTLTPGELRDTQAAWQKLIRQSLVSREEVQGGLRLEFHPRSEGALNRLIDVERECCRWISFRLEGPVVEMTATGEGEAAIRSLWLGAGAGPRA